MLLFLTAQYVDKKRHHVRTVCSSAVTVGVRVILYEEEKDIRANDVSNEVCWNYGSADRRPKEKRRL